jgi:hypothetical protein
VWTGSDAFVVRLEWRPVGGHDDQERFQVLRFRDEKIREMAEYLTLGEATRTAKRFVTKGKS